MYGMGAGPFAGGSSMFGGKLAGMKGAGFLKGLMGKQLGTKTLGGWANRIFNPWQSGEFSGKHAFGLGAAGLIAAPFIQKSLGWGQYQDDDEEPEQDWSITPGSISNIVSQARARDPSLNFLPSSNYAQSGWFGADGGRAGLLNGGGAGEAQMEQMLRAEYIKYRNQGGTMPYEQFKILVMQQQSQQGQMPNQMMAADGGRAGFRFGQDVERQTDFIEGPQENLMASDPSWEDEWDQLYENYKAKQIELGLEFVDKETFMMDYQDNMASGGRVGKQEGGLMDLGGQEKDYRDEGGFVALGGEERADDVPARLSKNEFVFTADAVRNAGGGDIDRGSEVMQNMMENLEQGGEISEDSQGLQGGEEIMSEEIIDKPNPAQGMLDNYEQLQSRVA